MIRTLKLKLMLTDEQKASLLRTMEAYTRAFEIAARWGYQNRCANKFEVHRGEYCTIRQEVPGLPAALVLTAKDQACEALKVVKFKNDPLVAHICGRATSVGGGQSVIPITMFE